jgi:glutamate racemase
VLGTSRTIEEPYIADLAARYGADCALVGFAAPELVEFVEYRLASADREERQQAVLPYIEECIRAGADAVVLGCTHFLLLLDDFKALVPPWMGIYDSMEGVSRRVEALLDKGDLRTGRTAGTGAAFGSGGTLVVTGGEALEPVWRQRAAAFDLDLRRLDEYDPAGAEFSLREKE